MPDKPIETGLAGLTAAVTTAVAGEPPKVPTTTLPVQLAGVQTPAVKEPLPDGWNLSKVAALVRDVAQSMYDLPVILTRHGLTANQYAVLASNEFFKRALEQFTLDWNSAANTQKRLSLEAAIALEDALPTIAARAHKPTEPLADVVSLVKVLAEIAGSIGAKAANQPTPPSERFKIVFNLSGDIVTREACKSPIQVSVHPEGEGNGSPIPPFLEAAGVPKNIQHEP